MPPAGSTTIESSPSAVSWAAILAGAVTAAVTSFVLIAIGSGLGFASISPWASEGLSATSFTVIAAIWLIVVQWLASGLGGYLAGRLRTRWTHAHTDEVFFRDTAHGLLAWAVAALFSIALLGSATSSLLGGGARAVASVASGAAQGASGVAQAAVSQVSDYDIDSLFRSGQPNANAPAEELRAEVGRIIANGLTTGEVPQADRDYVVQQVAARAGISPEDAQKRVDEAIARAKDAANKAVEAADTARKAAAGVTLYIGISMLIGAFIACVAAVLGGQQRDESL